MNLFRLTIAAAFLLTTGAASAQSTTDVGCLLVSNAFAQSSKDANAQKAAEAASYFYLGRIASQATAAQLRTQLDAQAKAISDASAGKMMNDCMAEIEAKMRLVQSLSPNAPQQPPKK